MDPCTAYFCQKEHDKKFEFFFRYIDSELELDQSFRFTLRPDETISDLKRKIKSVIGKMLTGKEDTQNTEITENEKKTKSNNKKPEIAVNFFHNGSEISNIGFKKFNSFTGRTEFLISNKKYNILLNTPQVISIELPKYIYVDYPVYLTDFVTRYVDKNKTNFFWYKSEDKIKWTQVGNSFSYIPSIEDVNCFLKFSCVPKNNDNTGNIFEMITSGPVQIFTDTCPFQRRHTYTKKKLRGKSFRVISYNILADHYCKSENAKAVYNFCPVDKLHYDYRKQLIFKELQGYNADIICLQEVDYKIYKNYLLPCLKNIKYKGHYVSKESRPEGLACFFNKDRFKLIYFDSIVIGKALKIHRSLKTFSSKISKNETAVNNLIEQNTVLQVVVLKSIENNEVLFVGNTHLYFHPDAAYIRLLQAAITSQYLEHTMLLPELSMKNCRDSLIYCGDFNSKPDSGVYTLFTKGRVNENAKDWSSNDKTIVRNLTLQNRRIMDSACGTPQYTNYTKDFKACLDYIFYEKSNLKVSQIVPLLTEEEMSKNVALPNIGIPSDHVALVADFEWL